MKTIEEKRKYGREAQKRWRSSPENRAKSNAANKDWQRRNPDKVKNRSLRHYGISLNEFHAMLGEQNGLCKICGMINDGYSLCVDHDHKTGAIRGLLCSDCNQGLGRFKDSQLLLDEAKKYLACVYP